MRLDFSSQTSLAQQKSAVKPSASPAPTGIRTIALTTNDLVFDPAGQRIYASLPSTAPNGNSLAQIDPYAGTVGTPVPIGSEPSRLAISDNSQYIYAGLNGVGAVRRFDIASQTPGLQFSLGVTDFFQTLQSAEDIAVMPGQPNTVAVSRKAQGAPRSHGVAIYDSGVMRPNTTPTMGTSINVIEFSSSPATLYGYNNETTEFGLRKMTIDSNGIAINSTTDGLLIGGDVDIQYANGLIYATSGRVIDPEALTVVGTFEDASSSSQGFPFNTVVLADPSANRVYFLIASLSGSTTTWTLKAFNLSTFVLTGSLTMPGVSGTPSSLIKWGDDGLAFRTSGNQVFLFSTADIFPTGTTPKPTPVQLASGITMLPLASGDLVYDPNTQKVYASIPSAAGSFGNSIAPIDPVTGAMGDPVFVGSEPGRLAISDNHQYLYTGLNGAGAVRRFDLGPGTAGPQYSLGVIPLSGALFPDDLQVLPGSPNSVAVSRRFINISPSQAGVAVLDDGVARPQNTGTHNGNNLIEFSSSAGALYGYDTESSSSGFRKMVVNASGVSIVSANSVFLGGDFKYDNGNVYGANGRVINPETAATLGTFSGANSLGFIPDASVNRVFFATVINSSVTLQAFDPQTFSQVGTLNIPGVVGAPAGMVRWGTDGLAMRTSGNQIYFIETSLVPPVVKSATSTTIASSQSPINQGQSVTFTATVSSAAGSPTGTVQFRDGATNLGAPQPLNGGAASVTTSSLAAGLRTITADYSGDANFLVSAATLAGSETVLPALSINDVSITEGDFGTKTLLFTVTLSGASNQTVKVDYATADGTATAGSDYVATNGTLTYNAGDPLTKTVQVTINGDQSFEPDEILFLNLSNPINASLSKAQGKGTILNDDAQGGFISFSQGSYSATESAGVITVRINRGNDVSRAATVDYATSDTGAPASCATSNGLASSRCDFIAAVGTLRFAPGETQKTFNVLVNQDSYTENSETFGITLSNLTGGAVLSGSSTASGIIFNSPAGPANVIDDVTTFVRQHYRDFLNRDADSSGLAFWSNEITSCGSDSACTVVKRINVSAAFFLSIEFQQTGYLVERFYKVAYGDDTGSSTTGSNHQLPVPIVRFSEFLRDTRRIGEGVIVLQSGWEQQLENNKQAYASEFVQTARFVSAFPVNLTPDQFVDKLNQNAGNVLSPGERAATINLFGGALESNNVAARAQAIRAVAEDQDLYNSEYNRAFVLAQYFGYLRRNPNDLADTDYTGYEFWLTKLNQFNGDYIAAEMVKAFISSSEYRQRFGP